VFGIKNSNFIPNLNLIEFRYQTGFYAKIMAAENGAYPHAANTIVLPNIKNTERVSIKAVVFL
jgi:hypothetical protein